MKQKCDELLSNFAFNFNLRRYTKAAADLLPGGLEDMDVGLTLVGRCKLPVSKLKLKARLVSALETEM